MPFSGTLTLLKTTCEEPCGNGGAGGGGGTNYQPQIDKINDHLDENDQKLTNLDVETKNIKNDIKTNYATKQLVNDAVDNVENQIDTLANNVAAENKKLSDRIDNIAGGGSGVDYGPDIEALKNKDTQLDQRIVDNAGNIQANTAEINNIKTNYVTKTELGTTTATIMSDCNDYTDEAIKNLNLGGGGSSTKLSDVFVIISVSIQDGNVVAQAFNPDDNSVLSGVNWDIRYKNCYFRSNSFTADSSVQIAQNNSYKYSQYDDAILFTNARIKLTWNNVEYIVGLKQTIMSYKDVDYVSESNLRLIAKKV